MSHFPSVPTPLELDDVQRVRVSGAETRLRLSGRWLSGADPGQADEALLVVQIEGRRHRFAPEPAGERPAPGGWTASFLLPDWAEPRQDGQAAVWIGEAVIPLPPTGVARRPPGNGPPALGSAVPADPRDDPVPPASSPEVSLVPDRPRALPSTPEAPRSGPLADMLLKETIAALHGELEARAAEAARLRGALAGAQSELEARAESHGELEGTLGELGAELRRLMEAVDAQREELDRRRVEGERDSEQLTTAREELAAAREEHTVELRDLHARLQASETVADRRAAQAAALREQLATAQVAREGAHSEATGLRVELERLGSELAVVRERIQSESGDLGQANRLLADARALAEQLRSGAPTG